MISVSALDIVQKVEGKLVVDVRCVQNSVADPDLDSDPDPGLNK
jgi:hypothetical protein